MNGCYRAYRFDGAFGGERYECTIKGLDGPGKGALIIVFIGADQSALFLLRHAQGKVNWLNLGTSSGGFRKNIRIPWTDLVWRSRHFLGAEWVWFEIPRWKTGFSVPKDVAARLLADGGQALG
jgi:hypothetical protein